MSSHALIFDKKGFLLDELDGTFMRSWKRNAAGTCSFAIPAGHHKTTERNFVFGNPIVVYHNGGLPPWVGRIETPRDWGRPNVTVHAVSAEAIFSERAGIPYMLIYRSRGPAGSCYGELVRIANIEEDTLMRPGQIYYGGRDTSTLLAPHVPFDKNITQLLKRSGHDYDITPLVVDNRLTLQANWYKRLGADLDMSLNENNCEMRENTLREEGPIKNSIFAFCEDKLLFAQSRDEASINKFGLRMKPLSVQAEDQETVQYNADVELEKMAWPRKTFQAMPRQLESITIRLRVGNRFTYENARVGFGKDGHGTEGRVSIEAMAFKDDEAIGVTLKEVLR